MMTSSNLWLCVSLAFICFYGADGFMHFMVNECVFNSTDLKDAQYIRSYVCNKQELVRWDSRVGKHVGYTEFGVKNAERFNNNPGYMAEMRAQLEGVCKPAAGIDYSNALSKTVKPSVILASVDPPGGRHAAMLQCSAYSFYPKLILVEWLRDGEPISSAVSTSAVLPDGDWYYQYHSFLEYTPRSGEKISCMVHHPALMEPLVVEWDDSMPEPVKNKVAIGASGLVLGLVLFLTGFIYYHMKKRGRVLVPTVNN